MNPHSAPKFLLNQSGEILQPINTQFSGIFNKALFTQESSQNKQAINRNKILSSPQNSESSNSTVETIDYEFLTPHSKTKSVRHHVTSSPNKELNLSEYFGRFMEKPRLLQNLDDKQMGMLRKISQNVPVDGNITFKTNNANELTHVVYYNSSHSKAINHKILIPSSLGLFEDPTLRPGPSHQIQPSNPPVKRKVGRPRNDSKRPVEKEIDPFEEDELVTHRMKSGRIVKLKPDMASLFQVDPEPVIQNPIPIPEIIPQMPVPQLLPGLQEPPKKPRKISSQFRCPACKKIYLGKNKMNHHYKLFPDHRPKASENDSALFNHLMTLVRQKKKNKDMADVFFKEISNFVQACEKLTPKLITNQDNHPNTHHHVVDKNSASLLRINPGNYRLNMNVFDKNFKLDSPPEPIIVQEEQEQEEILNSSETHDSHHEMETEMEPTKVITAGKEVIKALDENDVPSLDGNEVNLLIRQTNELTNLTNISDIVGETEDF